jgi:two-component system, NtrC family, response regulator AtoC
MAKRGVPAATTAQDGTGGAPPVGSRFLLVTMGGNMRVYPLPDEGDVVVGRDKDCHVQLDHSSISRQHARLRLGKVCTLVDLGSRNGTVFHGHRLPVGDERGLAPGDSFKLGPFSLLLIPTGAAPSFLPVTASRLRVDDPAPAAPSQLLVEVARASVNVVIYGETGVGKEVLAKTLHRLSGRSGRVLGINCAALSEALLESELFGHRRGAFTGAVESKPGLLQAAAGGTVLLDEIGDMAPGVQAKLLRAIETREVLPVGDVRPVAIDVRFLAATHRDLLALADKGGFRQDLYYRLAGVTLEIPPLRERQDQIAGLAGTLLADAAVRSGRAAPAITAAAAAALSAHPWPGNVRELRNVVERALLLSRGADIGVEHIVFDVSGEAASPPPPPDDDRSRILAALEACAGNQTHAARMLGMSRTAFVQRLNRHGVPRPRKPR